ncbi:MAG: MgtC/SapB family protein [Methanomicrobia archaeon]|nr:MgtC/SapB family protein [Methanomicrobia archaeon]
MEYLSLTTIIIRLVLAFVAGLVVGLERQIRMKPLGFGTFTLVAAGACAFMLVTEGLIGAGQSIPIATGVVTGIGFLGAGTLIKEGPSVAGFTTAAAIWLIGATGVAFGAGYYVVGVITTFQCLLVFLIDYVFEQRGFGGHSRRLTISFDQRLSEETLLAALAKFKPKIEGLEISQARGTFKYVFRVKINFQALEELGNLLKGLEGVTKFQVE